MEEYVHYVKLYEHAKTSQTATVSMKTKKKKKGFWLTIIYAILKMC